MMIILIITGFCVLSVAPFFRPKKLRSRMIFFFLWFFIFGELSAYLGLAFQHRLWMKTWYIPPLSDIEYLAFWITETCLVTFIGFFCYLLMEYQLRKAKKATNKKNERNSGYDSL